MPIDPRTGQPIPEQNQQMPATGSIRQNVSSGLTQLGFNLLGSAMAEEFEDPRLAAPVEQMGSNIVNTLRQRWFQKEHEDFQSMYGDKYKADSEQLDMRFKSQMEDLAQGIIGQNVDGSAIMVDPADPRAVRARDNIIRSTIMDMSKLDDGLMAAADKYRTNPFVSQKIQNIVQSRSQLIEELTGPTMAQQSEMNLAKIENTRADTRLKNRMPVDPSGGSGSKTKFADMSPRQIMTKLGGPIDFAEWLVGTPEGQQHMAGWQDMGAASYKQQLVAQDPSLAFNEDALNTRVAEKEAMFDKRGAAMYIADVFPELAPHMSQMPRFKDWFPQRAAAVHDPVIKGAMTKKEEDASIESAQAPALVTLERIIREKNPKTIDDAIGEWENKFLQAYTAQQIADIPATKSFRDRFQKEIRKWIRDPKNWKEIPIAAEKYAGVTPGKGDYANKKYDASAYGLGIADKAVEGTGILASGIAKAARFAGKLTDPGEKP